MRMINEHNYKKHHDEVFDFIKKLNSALGIRIVSIRFNISFQYILWYLKKEYHEYLMWPCFDELDLNFFVKSARYNIFPAGLLKGNIMYHDDMLMHCLTLMNHDFIHASRIAKEIATYMGIQSNDDSKK